MAALALTLMIPEAAGVALPERTCDLLAPSDARGQRLAGRPADLPSATGCDEAPAPPPAPTPTVTPTVTPTPTATVSPTAAPTVTATVTPTPTAAAATETAASVEALAAWLRTTTGRPFTSPADVSFDDAQPPTHQAIEHAITVEQWSLWSTLGLVDASHSRRSAAAAWLETAQGRCCPARIVRSESPLRTAVVTVHELAHALDWNRIERAPHAAHLSPVVTIAEGNAQRLARMWARSIGASDEEVEGASAVFGPDDDPRMPAAVRRILEYPYREGLVFALTVHEAGGEDAILEAFARPPNSAEVLHPSRWLNAEAWPDVRPPTGLLTTEPTEHGRLGAFVLALMIEPSLGKADATALMASWLGDAYAISHTIEQSRVAVRIVVTDEESAGMLEQALRSTGGFASSRSQTVNYTRCT